MEPQHLLLFNNLIDKAHHITYLLTPCSVVLLEKLTGSLPIKKFPVVYITRKFITANTSGRHLSLF